MDIALMAVSMENLRQRLAYFEGRLEEAKRKHAAKEPHPPTFDQAYTTETFKTWPESIALINERIAGIQLRMKAKQLRVDVTIPSSKTVNR
jgi:hypothetical protein